MGAFSWATDEDALLKRKRIYRPDAMINLWEYYVRMLQKHEKDKLIAARLHVRSDQKLGTIEP